MKIHCSALFVIIWFTCVHQAYSQRAKDWLILGDRSMAEGDTYGALRYYAQAMDLDSSTAELNYRYAEALRATENYPAAAFYYRKVYLRERAKVFPESGIWMAAMQQQSGDYEEAKQSWRKVRKQFEKYPDSFWYKKAIQQMRACDLSQVWMKENVTNGLVFRELSAPVNADGSSFDGIWTDQNTLRFTSLRGKFDEKGRLTSEPESYKPDFYETDSSFIELKNMSIDRPFTITEKWNAKMTYRAEVRRMDKQSRIFLFDSKNELPITQWPNNASDSSNYTHVCFGNINGKEVLFCSSDRAGGMGGYDIWYRQLDEDGDWENAGNLINTAGHEISPFYHTNQGTLYFSSDYLPGFGGFDIFRSSASGNQWDQPENLKLPYNTPANDLYYQFNAHIGKGVLTSNRGISKDSYKAGCCNKLFVWYADPEQSNSPIEYESLEDLNKYLPVRLYFHNDEPDPRTRIPETNQDYMQTYAAYIDLLPQYHQAYRKGLNESAGDEAEEAIDDFFIQQVDKGAADLENFTRLLKVALDQGEKVKLTVKGFASPLARTDYNVHLTSRRISSLVNYLKSYENGRLLPYFNRTATNGAYIEINAIPFGEYLSGTAVSDNPNEKDAVYGIGAALERKIELVSVQRSAVDSVQIDLHFDSELVDLGEVKRGAETTFSFQFTSEGQVNIDSLQYDHQLIDVHSWPETTGDGLRGSISGKIKTQNMSGKVNLILLVFGNFAEAKRELNITFQTIE